MSQSLDGPATGGFNNDISTVPPTGAPLRTKSISQRSRGFSLSSINNKDKAKSQPKPIGLTSPDGGDFLELPDEVEVGESAGGTTKAQREGEEGLGAAPSTGSSSTAASETVGNTGEEREVSNDGNESPDQLLQKATSTVKGLRMRILRFTPSWFSVTMGTGIVNVLLFLLPWQSTHAVFRDIGAAFWVLSVLIFIFFSILTIARYTLYPTIFMAMVSHPVHSLFLGTIPMGFVTIVSGLALLGNEYGISGTTEAAAGLWWFVLVFSITTSAMVPFTMQTLHQHTGDSMTAAWLLPVVPPITVAASSGVISNLLIQSDPDYALKIWTAGYVVNGVGLLVAGMILTLYYQRLSLYHLPGRETIISTFLPLGPCGQGGYALLLAGRNARLLFPIIAARNPDSDLAILGELGPSFYAIGISASLLLWGLGMWFFILAIASIISHRIRGTIVFGMGWWSLTFPIGSLNLLTYGLGTAFDNMFFKVLGTIMTAIVVFNWAAVFFPTLKGWWTGSLFQAPCLVKLPKLLNQSQGEKIKDKELGRT